MADLKKKTIQDYKNDYEIAKAKGDYDGMRTANEGANEIRKSQGLAIEDSSKGDLQYAQNRNLDTTRKTTPTVNAYKNAYTGNNRYVVSNGLNVDMQQDYKALEEKAETPQEKKFWQTYRNAKIDVLERDGYNNFGGKTYNYGDVTFSDYDDSAYNAYANKQNALMKNEVDSARKNANVTLEQLDATAKMLGLQTSDELRNLWVNSQLDQKALTEALAAQGITGGGAETARLGLDTAYRQGYANTLTDYNNSKAALAQKRAGVETDLATTINAIRSAYGSAVADAYYENLQRKAQAEEKAFAELASKLVNY